MGTPRFGCDYPDHFINNTVTISNKKDIANMCNNYFTNIGPKLSKGYNGSNKCNLGNRNNQNLFLTPVSEEEVIRTVNTWKCKTSSDCEDISMFLVKVNVVIALQHLARIFVIYLSLQEYARKKLKIAKVNPLFKSADKYMCSQRY